MAFFVTCMVDQLYPEVGFAAVELLERFGADVVFPEEQTCCGQPAFNAGYRGEARDMARHFLDVFWPLLDKGKIDAIVAPSGSCVAMVRNHYPLLFENEHSDTYLAQATQVADATFELTQYLVDILGVADTGARSAETLTYHPCCHLLRELEIDAQPRALLASLTEGNVVDLEDAESCCGFGGLFAVKNAEISTEIGRRKIKNIEASGANLVVVNDVSCMTHMNGLLMRENKSQCVAHIASVLNGAHSE